MLLINLAQAPQKILTVTLKWAKNVFRKSKKKSYITPPYPTTLPPLRFDSLYCYCCTHHETMKNILYSCNELRY